MKTIEKIDQVPNLFEIKYLVGLKYPRFDFKLGISEVKSEFSKENIDMMQYEAELRSKSPEEIHVLYKQEKINEQVRQEENRFFNLPTAEADLVHWSKMAYWTVEEGIALLYQKNPEVVNSNKLLSFIALSPFALQYSKTKELALRAVKTKQLSYLTSPSDFLMWAKRNDIIVPERLWQEVEAKKGKIINWEVEYAKLFSQNKKDMEEIRQLYNENNLRSQKLLKAKDDKINELDEEISVLKRKIKDLEPLVWDGFDKEKDTYSLELDIAVKVHKEASVTPIKGGRSPRQHIRTILDKNYTDKQISNYAKKRIATLINWKKQGGVSKTPS